MSYVIAYCPYYIETMTVNRKYIKDWIAWIYHEFNVSDDIAGV